MSWFPVDSPEADEGGMERLAALLAEGGVTVLTGAGCSTESGIPDYRGPVTGRRPRTPLTWQQFRRCAETRRRYWARALIGWPAFREAQPNRAHHALAALERADLVRGVITQNVDRLHHRAGSRQITELHGALHRVRCLDCGRLDARDLLQERLLEANPGWDALAARITEARRIAPDGDADLPAEEVTRFRVVGCRHCGGDLKPGVVMFGENVERPVRDAAFALADAARVLLVVGSSLTVYSGYRFVQRAARDGRPVALVNLGPPSRGAEACALRVDGLAGPTLEALCARLLGPPLPDPL